MISLDGSNLSCHTLHAIANGKKVKLSSSAIDRMRENASVDDEQILVKKTRWLVGTNVPVNANLSQEFILGHCAGVGKPFSKDIVRGAIAARTNVLATGYTGSRPIAAQKLIELLNKNITPRVPSQGSVGAAGDLSPMAHIARVVCGYGPKIQGYHPLVPTSKEALSLINGVSLSAAISAIAIVRAQRIFESAVLAAALTMEVIYAQSQCIDPKALQVRGHAEGREIGEKLRAYLDGSKRVHDQRNPDAFSIRCGPSVMGAFLRSLEFCKEEVENELNGCSDNPLFLDSQWLETGNFHGANIAMAMDHLKTALAQLATLSERRTFRLTHGKLSKNLPSFLVRGNGLNSGFMLAQYTAAALASEVKGLAHPASIDSIPTVQHHEDHVSMAPISARMALQAIECVADIVSIELLLGAQALDLRIREDGLEPPPALSALHKAIRLHVPFWEDDNVLHPAISAISNLVRSNQFFSPEAPW